jgi:hypothetical protein
MQRMLNYVVDLVVGARSMSSGTASLGSLSFSIRPADWPLGSPFNLFRSVNSQDYYCWILDRRSDVASSILGTHDSATTGRNHRHAIIRPLCSSLIYTNTPRQRFCRSVQGYELDNVIQSARFAPIMVGDALVYLHAETAWPRSCTTFFIFFLVPPHYCCQ